MTETRCAKCQSEKIIPRVRIIDQVGHSIRLGVNVYETPDALIFKGKHSEELHARICGACGNVEMYVDNPGELYSVYRGAGSQAG